MGTIFYAIAVVLIIAWTIDFIGFQIDGVIRIRRVIALIRVLYKTNLRK